MNNKLIVLKKTKIKNVIFNYILLNCTLKDYNYVNTYKELPSNLEELLISNDYSIDSILEVLYSGTLLGFKKYEEVVYKFPMRKKDIKEGKNPSYRDYTKSIKEQKDIMWLVNTISTAKISWGTIISSCKLEYGIILKLYK